MNDQPHHWRLLFPHDYIGAWDLQERDVRLEIKSVTVQDLKMAGGKSERKPVIEFTKGKKKWVLNKTNSATIASMHGTDPSKWAGKVITLFPTTTTFGRETVECIRVRPPGYEPEPQAERKPSAKPDPQPSPLGDEERFERENPKPTIEEEVKSLEGQPDIPF